MIKSDVFVLFDDVQFPRGQSFGNRVLIKTSSGAEWITVPVKNKSDLLLFNQVLIDYSGRWMDKALKKIMINYRKSNYFTEIYEPLTKIMLSKFDRLIDLNYSLIQFVQEYLSIKTKIIFSSDLKDNADLSGSQKIISILKALNASCYISGKGRGSARYINEEILLKEGIELLYQEFEEPYYKQLYGEYIPKLSIIDLLFNCGAKSSDLIQS